MLLDGNQLYRVPAPAVEAVDATGAGDVFRGAFIYALLRGDSPVDILRFANAAAALSCTREGALDSVPTRQEVEELLSTVIRQRSALLQPSLALVLAGPRLGDRRDDDRGRGASRLRRPIRFDRSSRRRCSPRCTCSRRGARDCETTRRSPSQARDAGASEPSCSRPRSASSPSGTSSYTASGADAYAYVTQADLLLGRQAHGAGPDRERGALARGRSRRLCRSATPRWRTTPRLLLPSDRACRC